jgi:hypothetical protein
MPVYAGLPLNTAMFCVTLSQRIHVISPARVAVSNTGVRGRMFSTLTRPWYVSPSAPGVPSVGIAVVAMEPGSVGTSGAGTTFTRLLCSGMFCRYESSPAKLMPAICLASETPKMRTSLPYAVWYVPNLPYFVRSASEVAFLLTMHALPGSAWPPMAVQVAAGTPVAMPGTSRTCGRMSAELRA